MRKRREGRERRKIERKERREREREKRKQRKMAAENRAATVKNAFHRGKTAKIFRRRMLPQPAAERFEVQKERSTRSARPKRS